MAADAGSPTPWLPPHPHFREADGRAYLAHLKLRDVASARGVRIMGPDAAIYLSLGADDRPMELLFVYGLSERATRLLISRLISGVAEGPADQCFRALDAPLDVLRELLGALGEINSRLPHQYDESVAGLPPEERAQAS